MKSLMNISTLVKRTLGLLTAVAILTNCSDEQEFIAPAQPQEEIQQVEEVYEQPTEVEVTTYNVSGMYVEFSETPDCESCTYVLADDVTVVDGAELDIKPGSVICLNKALEHKAIDFINLEGTEESPIVISYCGE